MSLNPTVEEQQLLADTLELESAAMSRGEQLSESLVAISFLAVAVAVWVLRPVHAIAIGPSLLCLAVFVVATLVRFETPFGFTVATQLAFVPLLFTLPLAAVAPTVVIGLVLARMPDVLRGRLRPTRLLLALGNSWFCLGAVLVFTAAGTPPAKASPLLLVAGLGGQFAADILASAGRTWGARQVSLRLQLGDVWVYAIDAALSGVAFVVARNMREAPGTIIALIPLLGLLAMFAHERRDRLQGLIELGNAYRGTALVLGDVLEADDGYTGRHSKGVVQLALAVGERLRLSPDQGRNLQFGALLHDVGKIAVPKEIINKPGPLDPEEWELIKSHTIEGQRMLDQVGGFMREVGQIVRSHHERWDGAGYPDGLKGEAIPLEARIITCCDTWHAMRSDRAYRKGLSFDVAMAELRGSSGSQLDPGIVDALAAVVSDERESEFSRAQHARAGADHAAPVAHGVPVTSGGAWTGGA